MSPIPKVAIVTGAAASLSFTPSEKGTSADLRKVWYGRSSIYSFREAELASSMCRSASLGPNAAFWEVNVADYDSQARMFNAVFKKWGRIDALLANAGIVDKSSIYILNYRNSNT
jgi:NADP-dependent 3-hydroxy acid dehydrogenase YdfG